MGFRRAVFAIVLVGFSAGAALAGEGEALLQDGSYEVKIRLQIPNVWNWTADRTMTMCIADAGASDVPFSVLSGNNPLADCPVGNVRRDGARLSFEIRCAGRDAARARAAYTLMPREFVGRIAMVMGAKNMTMTEVQSGRRVGDCDPASALQH